MSLINETHNVALSSWVESANQDGCDFSIQNLPLAIFRRKSSNEAFRGGVAIGDQVVDLKSLSDSGVLSGLAQQGALACSQPSLNKFMSMGKEAWSALRLSLSRALRTGSDVQQQISTCLVSQSEVEYSMPCHIGDYTDFYTSIHHATSVGKLFRPDNPLLPNYKWVPIGYHGRSSSIGISGQQFHRPVGQLKAPEADTPILAPCKRLDHELELGIFIGAGNNLGEAIPITEAENHVFGMCLFNDWSARDIQAWEYQPLGPFLSKSFASTISPWIVSMEALAPYRASFTRSSEDPQPLPYLSSEQNSQHGAIDIELEVLIQTEKMRASGQPPEKIANSNFIHSYWTIAQMVTHHSVNGCNLRPGDLFGSGTQSGPEPEEAGSLLELSAGGKEALTLSNGESRTFLEDGDTIVIRGGCRRKGAAYIGFGEVTSTVLPANS
ncbi:fumarylacetoacetate hydrolase [Colwellia chukchiensis]|uniref:fumarylacetoacetase n=1 Tax=Colwellia chukchiensis TaxID=641665 RepID=A0A1H7KPQ0_9GAMM|nr:fumarylacetoacetase [Colwellia chukchiensis]SEK88801.1 fumarylacetoacetate hydrolase [Colwellia chukchiensis]